MYLSVLYRKDLVCIAECAGCVFVDLVKLVKAANFMPLSIAECRYVPVLFMLHWKNLSDCEVQEKFITKTYIDKSFYLRLAPPRQGGCI